MLSLQFIREHPDVVREALERRGQEAPLDEILALDARRRELLVQIEALRADRNRLSKAIGTARDASERQALVAQTRALSAQIDALEPEVEEIDARLPQLLLLVPNLPDPTTPVGRDASENVVVDTWGEPQQLPFAARPHWELGTSLGILDFEAGAKVAGARFPVLRGMGARLSRALVAFMVDIHASRGYTEVYPPFLVRPEVMVGTGQLPKFAEDAYHVAEDDLYLIPTAEVPVTNLHREEILDPGTLPRYYVAYSACFRREAGAAGRETRGLIRVHQFDKVELVKFVEPETSNAELDAMVQDAAEVLRRLGLPYRVQLLCTGDLGFSARKTFDLEVWMPGQDRYVEISSCSNCGDFQARRARIQYRPSPGAHAEYVHTLNGSGLAVGRTIAAILENYQQADGTVVVPEALRPYLGGVERLQ